MSATAYLFRSILLHLFCLKKFFCLHYLFDEVYQAHVVQNALPQLGGHQHVTNGYDPTETHLAMCEGNQSGGLTHAAKNPVVVCVYIHAFKSVPKQGTGQVMC